MRRILLLAIPIMAAGLIALLVVSQSKTPPGGDVIDNSSVNTAAAPGNENSGNQNSSGIALDASRVAVTTVSRLFSERYGSTSSSHPTSNLVAALPFVSSSLKSAFERTIANPPAASAEPIVTTSQALAFNIQYIDDRLGRAGVIVSLQRSERKRNDPVRTYSQDLALQLVKENGDWKVNLAVFSKV